MSDLVNSSVRDELVALLRSNELPLSAVSAVEAALASVLGEGPGLVTLPTVGSPSRHASTELHPLPAPESERYRDVGPVGLGGTSEVRRVRDRHLNRLVAMKTLRAAVDPGSDEMLAFVQEAKASAELQHPNIVPVYDMGVHSDGRPWFTMREVVGRTLTEVIRDVHAVSDGHWGISETGWTLSRLIQSFQTVCAAVAYAHERGVMHRDLKPHNIMLGPLGEVYVLDWGLSKLLQHGTVQQTDTPNERRIVGTPAFMAPEQARGDEASVTARSDVYGLGAVLYAILANRPPYMGIRSLAVVDQVAAGPPEPLALAASLPLPPELVVVCERAMARNPADRFDSALDVAHAVRAWQDDTRKREQARQLVARSLAVVEQADVSLREAQRLRDSAEALLAQVKPWQPESDKIPGWDMLEAAKQAERRAALQRYQVDQGLYAALRIDRDLAEAHAALAERYLAKHAAAEAARDSKVMLRAEVSLHEHRDALAATHPTYRKLTTYLRGDGVLSLTTNPPGARVRLYRQVLQNRRLVDVFERDLGTTPLVNVSLAMGSYVCVLQMPGHDDVRYPVEVARLGKWDCVAPGDVAPTPIWLPPTGRFSADEIYIPAGWFRSGGDPDTYRSHPARRLWCDALVMQRFAVTNREYIVFLDALVAAGREDEALEHAPRERSSAEGVLGGLMYGRTQAGGFVIVPDADGDVAHPNDAVFHLDWHGAQAYMAWWAERTGKPWRLPGELEWEKAARGVDGRFYPWGDVLDPSWCAMHDSHQGRPMPVQVDTYPVDVSVYGVRGLGGNIRDWCADLEGQVDHERVCVPDVAASVEDPRRTVRGGSWFDAPRNARCANRDRNVTGFRVPLNGFRGLYRPTDD